MSNLPHRLFRGLAEARALLEKMRHGILLSELKLKIKRWRKLSHKDCERLISFMTDRNIVIVFQVKSTLDNETEIFIIKPCFEKNKNIPDGWVILPPKPDVQAVIETTSDNKNTLPHSILKYDIPEDGNSMVVKKETPPTAETLRKQAEALLKAAEEADRQSSQNDLFNKRLGPVRLELLQSVAAVQKQFDGMVDAMAVLESSAKKLRDLTA